MVLGYRIKQHILDNRWQYLLITAVLIAGMIMGNYKVFNLEGGVKSHLTDLIDNYLSGDMPGNVNSRTILCGAFFNQIKTIIIIWFLGLTVIGFPLILAVVFYRGFSVGFTIGFLVHQKGWSGVLLTFLTILPQNLIYVPFLLIWAVIGINFTVYLVNSKNRDALPLGSGLLYYTVLMMLFVLIFLVGAFIEAYLSPWLLSVVT